MATFYIEDSWIERVKIPAVARVRLRGVRGALDFCIVALAAACGAPDAPGQGMTVTGEEAGMSSPPEPTGDLPPTSEPLSSGSSAGPDPDSTTSGADTSGASTTSAGERAPICGDGVIDGELGEECDEGYANNHDNAACTMNCRLNFCGDGLVWLGQEECDDAEDNNDTLYQGCTTRCKWGARCGDGVLQGTEECDHGSDNGTLEGPPNGVPCTLGCRHVGKIVFVTSELHDGDLGGTSGAHLKCQTSANNAGLDNAPKFLAWISSGPISPAAIFEYGTAEEDIPYIRPDGVRLALDFADLIANGPGDGIVMTETKELVLDRRAWTGTDPFGAPFNPPHDCEGWTSAAPLAKGRVGRTGVDKDMVAEWEQWKSEKEWTSYKSPGCDNLYRLFCFEQ